MPRSNLETEVPRMEQPLPPLVSPFRGQFLASVRRMVDRLDWQAWLAFALPFTLYILTLAPTIYNLDSAELTTAAATGGILRATGYPLYLTLGRLWSLIPLGDVGYRMNLFSAFWGAATIFLADRVLRRLRVAPWARFGALGLLATAPYFWSLSLIAEVYTLHTALMAGVILLWMRWGEHPNPRRLALPIFLLALSMGNHASTVLLIPACLWYVLTRQPRALLNPRVYLAGILATLAGATVFLYLPLSYLANPAFNYAGWYDARGVFNAVDLSTLEGIVWLITGRTFAGQMFGYRLAELGPQVRIFVEQLWVAFFAFGLVPGLVGAAALVKRHWRLGGMLALMFLANALFFINYRVVDKQTMFLPTFLVWAIWLGYGYQRLMDWVRGVGAEGMSVRVIQALVITAVLLAAIWNWRRVDLSSDWSTRERSEAILNSVEENSLVFGWWETVPAIQYLQLVEGQRPDVLAINRFLIGGEDMNTLILAEIGQRPVYINNPSVTLLQATKITRVGPLYRLEPRE